MSKDTTQKTIVVATLLCVVCSVVVSAAAVLLKQAAGIAKGSGSPKDEKVGTVTKDQLIEIAKTKFEDLNAGDLEHASRIIAGTARSMGLEVVE